MPKSVSAIEAQAEYFANIPIIDRTFRATVHLESEEDEMFWMRFDEPIPRQCNSKELAENGKGIIYKIKAGGSYVNAQDKAYFQNLGLTERNAYMHIKGHTIYTLIKSIGDCICYYSNINFEKDILLDSLQTSGYWEVDKIREDIVSLR